MSRENRNRIFSLGMSVVFSLLLGIMEPANAQTGGNNRELYRNYAALTSAMTGTLRQYMKQHPEVRIDSLRRKVYQVQTEGTIPSTLPLQKERTTKLTATKIYELGKKSSLVFGKMDWNASFRADTAYTTASAVALTKDGICATNYHVVADVVLSGALNYAPKGDLMRFVMDYDGRIYPMTDILYVDPINDFALIQVDTREHELTPASIGSDRVPGEKVYCLSHPSGAQYYMTEGIVANCLREVNKSTGRTRYIMEITADYGVGASGGPIFDECGNLVSLVSSTFSLYANPQQNQNFQMTYKYTVPVFLLKECF